MLARHPVGVRRAGEPDRYAVGYDCAERQVDLAAALQGELFRPLATTIAPVTLALAPFSALAYSAPGVGREFWDSHPIAIGVGLVLLSFALGLSPRTSVLASIPGSTRGLQSKVRGLSQRGARTF